MKKFLLKLFSPFANEIWWPNWSNFRWRKALKDHTVYEEHLVKNLTEIKALVKSLYKLICEESQLVISFLSIPFMASVTIAASFTLLVRTPQVSKLYANGKRPYLAIIP